MTLLLFTLAVPFDTNLQSALINYNGIACNIEGASRFFVGGMCFEAANDVYCCLFWKIRLLFFCFLKKCLNGEGKDNQAQHGLY
jgi:hypothetical protein